MMDKLTGKPRGFGFVVFETVEMVDAVLSDYGKHRIDGKWVDVKRATPQDMAQGPGFRPPGFDGSAAPAPVPPPAPNKSFADGPGLSPQSSSQSSSVAAPGSFAQVPPPTGFFNQMPPPSSSFNQVPPP
ncbi:unnamed protein product, partial [Polarella glacialis]